MSIGYELAKIPSDGTVSSPGECLAETIQVKSFQSWLTAIDAAEEDDRSVIVEQIDDLLIQTFVEVISVLMLELADSLDISGFVCNLFQFCNFGFQYFDLFVCHVRTMLSFEDEVPVFSAQFIRHVYPALAAIRVPFGCMHANVGQPNEIRLPSNSTTSIDPYDFRANSRDRKSLQTGIA